MAKGYLRRDEAVAQLYAAQQRIAELEEATKNLREETTVMLSARVPRQLRDQVRVLGMRRGLSMQDTIKTVLQDWVDAEVAADNQDAPNAD